MIQSAPMINFNGAFLVNTLVVGHLRIHSKRVFAVKILLHQTLNYPVLAYENNAAEIYAYCYEWHQLRKPRIEAYAPCYLVADQQSGALVPVIGGITWYIPSSVREKRAQLVGEILNGEIPGDEIYPVFQGSPFAVFTTR